MPVVNYDCVSILTSTQETPFSYQSCGCFAWMLWGWNHKWKKIEGLLDDMQGKERICARDPQNRAVWNNYSTHGVCGITA